jgi:hypothetical protein
MPSIDTIAATGLHTSCEDAQSLIEVHGTATDAHSQVVSGGAAKLRRRVHLLIGNIGVWTNGWARWAKKHPAAWFGACAAMHSALTPPDLFW